MNQLWRRLSRGTPVIYTGFDFRDDTPEGADPDAASPTLRRYHRLLWSKALPSGNEFSLVESGARTYLQHRSEIGEFTLSSDTVVPSFSKNKAVRDLIPYLSQRRFERFMRVRYTIGGMMLFPSNKVDKKMTINGARGCHPRIKDRFDLTVECIRRYYRSEDSPLAPVFDRYAPFFALFGSFDGYVDFFLLQDIVSADYSEVKFHAPFMGFGSSPVPGTHEEYARYLDSAEAFIRERNKRIRAWSAKSLDPANLQAPP